MKTVLILSGGLDSTTLLAELVEDKNDVVTLTFNYGSKHNERERESVYHICKHYNVSNQIVDLPLNNLFKSDLLLSGGSIPNGHYEDFSMRRTVVPFRNAIMLSIAVGYAESIDYDRVAIGCHTGDHAVYPDCRSSFILPFRTASQFGTHKGINIYAPYIERSKCNIVQIGYLLRVPYEMTYSCYNGDSVHCGTCGTCTERKEAFKMNKIEDPTIYSVEGIKA